MTVTEPAALGREAGHAGVFSDLDVLTLAELDVLESLLRASWRMVSAVHPLCCPLWEDGAELLADCTRSWWVAFAREHPDHPAALSHLAEL